MHNAIKQRSEHGAYHNLIQLEGQLPKTEQLSFITVASVLQTSVVVHKSSTKKTNNGRNADYAYFLLQRPCSSGMNCSIMWKKIHNTTECHSAISPHELNQIFVFSTFCDFCCRCCRFHTASIPHVWNQLYPDHFGLQSVAQTLENAILVDGH